MGKERGIRAKRTEQGLVARPARSSAAYFRLLII